MKKLLILCLFSALSFALETGESCAKLEDSTKRLACYDSVFVKQVVQTDTTQESKWEYETEKDEMRNASTYLARNSSINTVDLGFPYHATPLTLLLRKDPKYGSDIIFVINGQYAAGCFNGCKISAKFDNGKIENYAMVGSDSGGNDTLFIESKKSQKAFMDKLRKSKKLVIEASLYNYGEAQFSFDIQGLKWEHF